MAYEDERRRLKMASVPILGSAFLVIIAVLMQIIQIDIKYLPDFMHIEFSLIPEMIGTLAYGPIAGVVICFVKNIVHLIISNGVYINELSNLLINGVGVCVMGFAYGYNRHRIKSRKSKMLVAFLSGLLATVVMTVVGIAVYKFITYPMFCKETNEITMDFFLKGYQKVRLNTASVTEGILYFNAPFIFLKGLVSSMVTAVLYPLLSRVLHKRTVIKAVQEDKEIEMNYQR